MVAAWTEGDCLAGTKYTVKWMLDALKQNDKKFREIIKCHKLTKILCSPTNYGGGETSNIYCIQLMFENNHSHCVLYKVPQSTNLKAFDEAFKNTRNGKQLLISTSAHVLYETELKFYRYFGKSQSIPMPKIFAVERSESKEREGAILMEYLGDATVQSFSQPLNVAQVISATKAIAKLAATSLASGYSIEEEFPLSLKLFESLIEIDQLTIQELIDAKPKLFKEKLTVLKRLLDSPNFIHYVHIGVNRKLGIPSVLAHADLHISNLMWKKLDDGSAGDELEALIDWQMTHTSTVAYDLAMVLLLDTDAVTRRSIEQWIFEYFHALLKYELKILGMEMPFSVKQISLSYRPCIPQLTLFLICLLVKEEKLRNSLVVDNDERWQRLSAAVDDSLEILKTDAPQFCK